MREVCKIGISLEMIISYTVVMAANYSEYAKRQVQSKRGKLLICKLGLVKMTIGTKGLWGDRLRVHGLAYPEGTVGDADTSPRNHGCVLHWLSGHIRAAISAIAIVLDCRLHRAALIVL